MGEAASALRRQRQEGLPMALATFDRQEADRFAREFEDMFCRGDAATMTSFYTQHAMILAPDSEAVRGRRAIQEFWNAACQAAQRTGMKRAINVQHLERSGNLGYLVSTVTLEIPDADGQPTTITFNDVTIWQAGADGRWRVAVDSANRTAPLQTPPSLSRP
jgi:ketosteroid isomerase-like protein